MSTHQRKQSSNIVQARSSAIPVTRWVVFEQEGQLNGTLNHQSWPVMLAKKLF